jgi:hypothetical protein
LCGGLTSDWTTANLVDISETRDNLVLHLEDDLDLVEATLNELDWGFGGGGLEVGDGGDGVEVGVGDWGSILEDDFETVDNDTTRIVGGYEEQYRASDRKSRKEALVVSASHNRLE